MIFSFSYIMILIPFLLSHRDFSIWYLIQKAQKSGHQLLEISEIQGIFDILDHISVPDGCRPTFFCQSYRRYHVFVSKKFLCLSAPMRHIYLGRQYQKYRINRDISENLHISKDRICALCVSYQNKFQVFRQPHLESIYDPSISLIK